MSQSKFFRFVFVITCIIFIYNLGSERIIPKIDKIKSENSFLNAEPAKDPSIDTYNYIIDKKDKANLGYAEKKLAGVLAAFLETPEGKTYANSIMNSNASNSIQGLLGTLDYLKPNEVIKLDIDKKGNGAAAKCGGNINIIDLQNNKEDKVIIGNDDVIKFSGYIFNQAKEGDIRIVKYKDNSEKKYQVKKIIDNHWKSNLKYNLYNITKGYIVPYCGAKFNISFNISDESGNAIYKNSKSQMHYAFDTKNMFFMDVISMNNIGGQTIVIVNAQQIKNIGIIPKEVKLGKSNYYIIDITSNIDKK